LHNNNPKMRSPPYPFMFAEKSEGVRLDNPDYIAEQKLDGCRCMACSRGLMGRENDYTQQAIELSGDRQKMGDAVLDGELKANTFQETQIRVLTTNKVRQQILSKRFPMRLLAFDILFHNGKDLRGLPLLERKAILKDYIAEKKFSNIDYVEHYETAEQKQALWDEVVKTQQEGIMLKRQNSVYASGVRSDQWLKMKFWKERVMSFTEYEDIPTGIVLIAGQDRVTLNGEKADGVKKTIVERGSISAEIQYLEFEVSGKMRFPSLRGFMGVVDSVQSVESSSLQSQMRLFWGYSSGGQLSQKAYVEEDTGIIKPSFRIAVR